MEHRYYLIDFTDNLRVVGNVYPQIDSLHKYDKNHYPGAWDWLSEEEIAHTLYESKLRRGAKLTDILNPHRSTDPGLVFSERVKTILSEYRLWEHQYIKGTLTVRDKVYPYYWLHFRLPGIPLQYIDYAKCIFACVYMGNKPSSIIHINSHEEYRDTSEQRDNLIAFIELREVVLTDDFTDDYDMLVVEGHTGVFISARLRERLAREKITGYDILDRDFVEFAYR